MTTIIMHGTKSCRVLKTLRSNTRGKMLRLLLASSSILFADAFLNPSYDVGPVFRRHSCHGPIHLRHQRTTCAHSKHGSSHRLFFTTEHHLFDTDTKPSTFPALPLPPFAECWNATAWSVNPQDQEHVNEALGCFSSPAPQVYFAFSRALDLSNDEDHLLDVLQTFSTLLTREYAFQILEKRNRNDSTENNNPPDRRWRIVSTAATIPPDDDKQWQTVSQHSEFPTTLSIAHRLLDLAVESNQQDMDIMDEDNDNTVSSDRRQLEDLAIHRLNMTLGVDTRGRASADAAFALAMAGITRPELYDMLTEIAYQELQRTGPRQSFPSKYILQIVEKLAAAGMHGIGVSRVYRLAATLMREKKDSSHHQRIIDSLEKVGSGENEGQDAFGLHSTWPLLWLWRFAARQRKAHTFIHDPRDEEDSPSMPSFDSTSWDDGFSNTSRPLVIDIGCGMGVSLLGLATANQNEALQGESAVASTFGDSCNYLGGDLSHLSINFAKGIAKRWGIDDCVQFSRMSAMDALQSAESHYPNENIQLIMIQFPTPFKLRKDADEVENTAGNQQLPSDEESGFMVTTELLRLAAQILSKSGGQLLLQSNCEDVAVKMRCIAEEEAGFECVGMEPRVLELPGIDDPDIVLPQRSREYIQMGGERPVGPGWMAKPLLPRAGCTETEVNCELQGTPVHRCLLRIVAND